VGDGSRPPRQGESQPAQGPITPTLNQASRNRFKPRDVAELALSTTRASFKDGEDHPAPAGWTVAFDPLEGLVAPGGELVNVADQFTVDTNLGDVVGVDTITDPADSCAVDSEVKGIE
jgi:hypothetical protein